MNIEKIKDECETMQANLECVIPDGINEVIDHAKMIAVFHARTGYMLAQAKLIVRSKKTSEIGDTIVKIAKENFLSAKAQNALVDSIAADEMFIVDWLDRLNSMCVHQIDLMRSIISKEKEELRIVKSGY